jgi:hypothetical protein
MMRPSLFIVALPRSLSSLIFHAARQALALRQPEWTTDGEILNVRRFAMLAEAGPGEGVEGLKYVERQRDSRRFEQLLAFLDQATRGRGFVYKDVIQPFVVAEWLAGSGLRVLHLDRPVPDVAWAMLDRGWHYPAQAAAEPGTVAPGDGSARLERALVAGLLRAHRALCALGARRLSYDELIQDEEPLRSALHDLYAADGCALDDLARPAYIDDEFSRVRDAVLRRRGTNRYRRLAELCEQLAAEPGSTCGGGPADRL